MSMPRPTVSADLVAALIDSTPDRVRRRLDQSPDAASAWNWQASAEAWSVHTGAESVTLPLGHVLSVEQVRCTCLLSPRCFHVLACLTRLEVAITESAQAPAEQAVESEASETDEDLIEPDEKQRRAARELTDSLAHLLMVGVVNAGVVVQSGLLRAAHQCRAEGLHRLAAMALRVSAGISEIRARAAASDPAQLADDLADALETSRHVLQDKAIAGFWIGTARRKQMPVRPRKLHGLFAEPIITRSGFAGAAVTLLGEDERFYTASDVRPGDAQHARDAYLGGIEIGPLIQPAKQLARGLYLGTDLTAALDGRLGRGKAIKLVEQGQSTWDVEPVQARFQRPLADQWNAVYASAALPADARPAGWDLAFLTGTIVGALGPELLFQPTNDRQPIRLAIENESKALYFRENLRILSHAPGLRLQVIGRVDLQQPRVVSALAIATVAGDPGNNAEPGLEIPVSLAGRVCLGFDEIQRHFLINAQPSPVVLGVQAALAEQASPLDPLRRRWIARMLSGSVSQRQSNVRMLSAETTSLSRNGFATGAALLEALTAASSDRDTFLAAAVYLRSCGHELTRASATLAS